MGVGSLRYRQQGPRTFTDHTSFERSQFNYTNRDPVKQSGNDRLMIITAGKLTKAVPQVSAVGFATDHHLSLMKNQPALCSQCRLESWQWLITDFWKSQIIQAGTSFWKRQPNI